MEINRHRRVCRIIVHVTHADDLDTGIFLLHLHRVVVHDLAATVTKLIASLLSACAGWEMGHIDGKVLAINSSVNHQDVAGLEIVLLLLCHDEIYTASLKGERNGLAFDIFEDLRLIEKSHIHATSIRTVIMNDLIVRLGNLRLHDKVLKDKSVLYFRHAKHRMPYTVILLHTLDNLCHVLKFLLILRFSPFVLSLRKELLIVLHRIIVCVKKVLQIVKTDDMVLLTPVLGSQSD